ncbi:MAG: CdaR family protein [Bacillota bacterium]
MLEHFRKNLVYRIISLLAAIFIWYFVFSERNPTTENVVTVPLEVVGLSRDLVVSDKPANVNIRFQGKRNVVDRMTSRDFRAIIELQEAETGAISLPVKTQLPQGVRLVSVQPNMAQVEIDQVTSTQIPVELVIQGSPARGYIMETPWLTPSEVLVKGPDKVLDNIGRAYVKAVINDISMDYFQALPVLIEDASGRLVIEWVEVIPRSINVLIPVVEDMPSRIVPIVPELIGEPAAGRKVEKVLVHPATVKIYGSRDIINEIGFIPIEINISGLHTSHIIEMELEAPDGIEALSENNIQIIVEVVNEG